MKICLFVLLLFFSISHAMHHQHPWPPWRTQYTLPSSFQHNPQIFKEWIRIISFDRKRNTLIAQMLFNDAMRSMGTIDNPIIECSLDWRLCSMFVRDNMNLSSEIPLPARWTSLLQEVYKERGIEGKW